MTDTGDDDVLSKFRRFGSAALTGPLAEVSSFGLTGETYYDFDKGLDPTHPITIIHFNDVYNIEPDADGAGGISRFVTALRMFADSNPLILFSGDAFNPSFISTFTKGRHMVPFLNMLKVHTACIGNHDLDFGVDHLEYLCGSSRFPWLLSNIFDRHIPGRTLGGAPQYRLFEWQGHRVGVMGLVEFEWIATLAQVELEDIIYEDFVVAADRISQILRDKECDLIIALTHMRAPNDERLARKAKDIDLILGGHDHEYYGAKQVGDRVVVKSGTDFREFTVLTIYPGGMAGEDVKMPPTPPPPLIVPGDRSGGTLVFPNFSNGSTGEWRCVDVSPSLFPSNRHVDKLVAKYITELSKQMDKELGETAVDLETRFKYIRTEETNVGNWLADLMRQNTRSDVAILNSGTVRSDRVIPKGVLKVRDLVSMLPMPDELAVIEVSGVKLRQALEVSCGAYPVTEGRFLQVSGLRFAFDPEMPKGERVLSVDLLKDGEWRELKDDAVLRVCTKEYIASGHDGYDCLVGCKLLMTGDETPNLPTMVQNSFTLAAMASGQRKARNVSTLRRVDTYKAMTSEQQKHSLGMIATDRGYKLHCTVEGRIINIRKK